jgi:serine/threonine-protein kinase SRPK3
MLDAFKLKGSHGQHLCIVYDVLREPIGLTMEKLPGHLFGSHHLRILLPALLQGLDYLHAECHIVHTDLKPDNIMMGLGDPTILDRVVRDETSHPSPRKTPDSHGRIIYQSRSDFGDAPTDAVIASAKITDIGLATWGDERNNYSIQSNAFTAPEVILAAGWSYPADIWNLGVMLWDLFENFGLFDAIDTGPSRYQPTQHLGLMIALMGPPPKELLDRGSTSATYFDGEGKFRHPKLIRDGVSFESSITRFKGKDKELFIDFVKKMICWLPEERWTAKQLLQHPWLREREGQESADSGPSSQVEDDAKPVTTTGETAKTNPESNSISTTTSSTAVKIDPNASSSKVIRAILDR